MGTWMINPKPSAPVVGFNHNVKYGPRVYHVQTEDSGLPHAHYITHLFVGGNIVASMKSSYADQAPGPGLQRVVRGMMEQQHKAMLRRLIAGEFDHLAERLGAHHYQPGVLADGTNTAAYVNTGAQPKKAPTPLRAAPKPAPARAPAAPAARPVQPPRPPPAPARAAPQVWQAAPPSASPAAPRTPGSPLPHVTRQPGQPTRPSTPPRMAPVAPPAPRPAPRPAAAAPSFFSDSPVEMPAEDLPTLFAEELISEKSLDEVILAFLSADLEPPK
ncbi:MAG TPA: hypothetical protein VFL36_17430 [Myxococcales bacterium]|nr:hypothetical protein [Myxococcales bacterium]